MTEKNTFYGWKLLVVVGLLFFCSSSFIMLTGSVVSPLMLADPSMKLNGKLIGLSFTIFILCQGLPAPLIGQFIDKFGQKKSFLTGGVLMVLGGLAMATIVTNAILFVVIFGVVLSIGAIMAGQFTMQSSISTWFVQKRARAMAIAMIFGSVGSFLAPLIVQAIVNGTGGSWQAPWYFISGLGIVVIIIAALFVYNKPSDLGQFPDGISDASTVTETVKASKVYKNLTSINYNDAIKTPVFWFMAIASAATFTGYSLAASQGAIHFTTLGFSAAIIAAAISGMAIGIFLGRVSIVPLGDRFEPSRILGIYLVILTIGIFIASQAASPTMPYVYYFLTGLAFGGGSALMPVMVGNYFGNDNFPRIWGTVMLLASLVSGAAPIVSGAIFDATGSLSTAFMICAVVTLIGAIACFLVKIPKNAA
ncbi:MAG TPA: MFS transporter [Syntrophomonadaceae bacterium]|nr:MFS transporter [Syntrophomonadaceae bacterium]